MKGYRLEWVVASENPEPWWEAYCKSVAGAKIVDGKLMRLVWVPEDVAARMKELMA